MKKRYQIDREQAFANSTSKPKNPGRNCNCTCRSKKSPPPCNKASVS